jgi:hypothetical protein
MKKIPVKVQLGIYGDGHSSGTLDLNEQTIGNSSSWAGSYHILSMGRHYHDYIYHPESELPTDQVFPKLDTFGQLTSKIKSQQVVGNIGECIAALLARNRLSANVSDIVLLTMNAKRMRPDYLMNLEGSQIRGLFYQLPLEEKQLSYFTDKRWWPVESKATKKIGSINSREKGLSQLISFWAKEKESLQDSAGCALIVTFFYEDSVRAHQEYEIWVSLILPWNRSDLITQLSDSKFNSKKKEDRARIIGETFRYFHSCNNQ